VVTGSFDRLARVLVAFYSATGHVRALAGALARGAGIEDAEVWVRPVEELAAEMLVSQNQAWGRHRSEPGVVPAATLGDLGWADGIAFGTPTRFGNVSVQLKMFLDQAGELWQEGKLINKVVTCVHLFADCPRRPGVDDPRAQQHVLSLGVDRAAAWLHGQRGV
jgi:multimeric flavodoxin WrbA